MTATTTSETIGWERFRTAVQAEMLARVPEHVQRLGWSAGQLEAAQRDGLRRLLAHAAEHSPFHRRRLAGVLHYGEIDIHPLAVRSVMVKTPDVVDYQVRQTPRGVQVDAVTAGSANVDRLAGLLAHALTDAGLSEPDVTVRIVDSLQRHHETGKLRRFVPVDPR